MGWNQVIPYATHIIGLRSCETEAGMCGASNSETDLDWINLLKWHAYSID